MPVNICRRKNARGVLGVLQWGCMDIANNLMPILGTLIVALLGWLVAEQRLMRSDIGDLRERMARIEGRVDTLVDMFTREATS